MPDDEPTPPAPVDPDGLFIGADLDGRTAPVSGEGRDEPRENAADR